MQVSVNGKLTLGFSSPPRQCSPRPSSILSHVQYCAVAAWHAGTWRAVWRFKFKERFVGFQLTHKITNMHVDTYLFIAGLFYIELFSARAGEKKPHRMCWISNWIPHERFVSNHWVFTSRRTCGCGEKCLSAEGALISSPWFWEQGGNTAKVKHPWPLWEKNMVTGLHYFRLSPLQKIPWSRFINRTLSCGQETALHASQHTRQQMSSFSTFEWNLAHCLVWSWSALKEERLRQRQIYTVAHLKLITELATYKNSFAEQFSRISIFILHFSGNFTMGLHKGKWLICQATQHTHGQFGTEQYALMQWTHAHKRNKHVCCSARLFFIIIQLHNYTIQLL